MSGLDIDDLKNRVGIVLYSLENWYFDDSLCENTLKEHFRVNSLEGLGLADLECGMIASGSLLKYLYETQKNSLEQISAIHPYTTGKFMVLDSSTRRNLELVETLREKAKRGSLLWVLDKTKTAMGARMLRSFVEQPLIEKEEIEGRLDAIEELMQRAIDREELREYLNPVYDLEPVSYTHLDVYKRQGQKSGDGKELSALYRSLHPVNCHYKTAKCHGFKSIKGSDLGSHLCRILSDRSMCGSHYHESVF